MPPGFLDLGPRGFIIYYSKIYAGLPGGNRMCKCIRVSVFSLRVVVCQSDVPVAMETTSLAT